MFVLSALRILPLGLVEGLKLGVDACWVHLRVLAVSGEFRTDQDWVNCSVRMFRENLELYALVRHTL